MSRMTNFEARKALLEQYAFVPGRGRVPRAEISEEEISAAWNRKAYSAEEVADMLGCSLRHVRTAIKDGEIPSFTVGRRRFVPASAIEALIGGAK